jgi:hypothetical protein
MFTNIKLKTYKLSYQHLVILNDYPRELFIGGSI